MYTDYYLNTKKTFDTVHINPGRMTDPEKCNEWEE